MQAITPAVRRSDDCGSAGTTSLEIETMATKSRPEDDRSQLHHVYFRVDVLKQKVAEQKLRVLQKLPPPNFAIYGRLFT